MGNYERACNQATSRANLGGSARLSAAALVNSVGRIPGRGASNHVSGRLPVH